MSGTGARSIVLGCRRNFVATIFSLILFTLSSPVLAEAEISGGLTMIGMGASGVAESEADTGLNYSVDLFVEGEVGDGNVFIYLNSAEGADLVEGDNADYEAGPAEEGGFSSTGIAEAWYMMPVFDETNFTVGKIDATGIYDGNEVANDQTTQFLAGVLVNNAAIPFPAYTAGFNLGMEFGEAMNFNVGMFEDEGLKGDMEFIFTIAELGMAMEFLGGESNLRVTYWQNDAASGFAFNADHNMDELKFFLRVGTVSLATDAADEDVEAASSLGLSYELGDGLVLGVGYSTETPKGTTLDARTWTEGYVSYEIDEDLAVSVDLQNITARDFDATADPVSVYGVRLQAGF